MTCDAVADVDTFFRLRIGLFHLSLHQRGKILGELAERGRENPGTEKTGEPESSTGDRGHGGRQAIEARRRQCGKSGPALGGGAAMRDEGPARGRGRT